MIVVSNSSPLIALSRIGRLEILASFYERILVPAEVHYEVTVDGRGLPGAEEVRKAVWIEVAPRASPTDPLLEQACQGLLTVVRGGNLVLAQVECISQMLTPVSRAALPSNVNRDPSRPSAPPRLHAGTRTGREPSLLVGFARPSVVT